MRAITSGGGTVPGRVAQFTFFVDADAFPLVAGELPAAEADLFDHGVERVEIPRGFDVDLADRIPVLVVGEPRGLRFYARLLGRLDPLQVEELERVCSAAERRQRPAP